MFKKWKTGLLVLLGLIAVLMLSANFIITHFVRNAVETELDKLKTKHDLYWKMQGLDVNVYRGNMRINQLRVHQDSADLKAYEQGKVNPTQLLRLNLDSLSLNGFNLYNILIRKKFQTKGFTVSGLDLSLHQRTEKQKQEQQGDLVPHPVWDSIAFLGVQEINFGTINIDRASFRILNYSTSDTLQHYRGRSLAVNGLILEPEKSKKKLMKLNTSGLNIRMIKQQIGFDKANYTLSYDTLDFDKKKQLLRIKGLGIEPTTNTFELASSYRLGKDVYKGKLSTLKAYGFRFDELLHRGLFMADSVKIDSALLQIYKDHKMPKDTLKQPQLPQQALIASALPLYIPLLKVEQGKLTYREFIDTDSDFLRIHINDIGLKATQLRSPYFNDRSTDPLEIETTGVFQNIANFDIWFEFPYKEYTGFKFRGNIGPFKYESFNPVFEPLTNVRFTQGQGNGIEFNSYCNGQTCEGSMAMRYDEIKLKMLEKDGNGNKWFNTFVANILIRQNNPVGNNLKTVPMRFDIKPWSGTVNQLTGSLLGGIKETIKP
ncbi:hypothetical protein PP178_05195 [Zeaxanthinibacter sp. PT1]|uniref:hypothetical protein n=1 Tax=Zeaxanthinibacter TaxID=561554 RepID=UPI0023490FE8|nr:hypothetical protein [Zeaxanthinibacter sp. PT1]MDC6350938.1 hypothetical protein [Zeaxanthinibacter sp. PT1]